MLCEDCNRWVDREGRHLLGWQAMTNIGPGFFPLSRGHRPPDHTIDAATGWSPVHGECVPGPVPITRGARPNGGNDGQPD